MSQGLNIFLFIWRPPLLLSRRLVEKAKPVLIQMWNYFSAKTRLPLRWPQVAGPWEVAVDLDPTKTWVVSGTTSTSGSNPRSFRFWSSTTQTLARRSALTTSSGSGRLHTDTGSGKRPSRWHLNNQVTMQYIVFSHYLYARTLISID